MNPKRVLIAYGSRHGATRGIGEAGRREHITFGEAVTADNPDLVARAMVRHGKGGDLRNPAWIQEWARHTGTELGTH